MEPLLIPLTAFAIACCATPGPNNMMLTASGANFGFLKTIPHILGINFGMSTLFAVASMGLGSLFSIYPQLQTILKIGGVTYLFYLSWKIARTRSGSEIKGRGKPFSFVQAAAFQFMNPKAFFIALTAISTFTVSGEGYPASALLVTTIFFLVCMPSVSIWAGFGTAIGRLLNGRRSIRLFNISMGSLTAASALMLV